MQFVSLAGNSSIPKDDLAVEDFMPWSIEEEVVISRSVTSEELLRPTASISSSIRSMLLFAAASSIAAALVRTMQVSSHLDGDTRLPQKHFV